MTVHNERGLNAVIIDSGEMDYTIAKKLDTKFFNDPVERNVFAYILRHNLEYGKVPDLTSVHQAYPNYQPVEITETERYFVDRLRDEYLRVNLFADLSEILADPDQFMQGADGGERLWDSLSSIVVNNRTSVPIGLDTDFYGTAWDFLEPLLASRKGTGSVPGAPTGFPSFDLSTGGIQPERVFTLIGVPKSGKSSLALKIALNASMNGTRVLFVTFEMTNQEQIDRSASLLSGVSLTDILHGNLTPKEHDTIRSSIKKLEGLSGFLTFIEDRESSTTLSGLNAKIKEYQPELVVVDGAYMMQDEQGEPEGSPAALTHISRGLKRLAQNNGVGFLITTQALLSRSRRGLTMESAGYSSAWAQDADVLFGVERMKDHNDYSTMKVLASRSGPITESYLHVGWDKGLIEEVPLALIPQAQDSDDDSDSFDVDWESD